MDNSYLEEDYDDDGMTVEQIIALREEEEATDLGEVDSEDEDATADDPDSKIIKDDGLEWMAVETF